MIKVCLQSTANSINCSSQTEKMQMNDQVTEKKKGQKKMWSTDLQPVKKQ